MGVRFDIVFIELAHEQMNNLEKKGSENQKWGEGKSTMSSFTHISCK